MPAYFIKEATIHDAASITGLINSAYRGLSSKRGWTNEIGIIDGPRMDETEVLSMIDSATGKLFKSVNEVDEIIGCVYLEMRANDLYLGTLTVSPERQALGIGKMMLHFAEEYAREKHCTSILMTVVSERTELIDWYVRNGFLLTGESFPFPIGGRFGTPLRPLQLVELKKVL